MKNLVKSLTIIISLVFFISCFNSNTPEIVAKKFLGHIAKKEYNEAKKLCTERSVVSVDQMESIDKLDQDSEKEQKESKIENINCKIEGETATCTYLKDGKEGTINLIKENKVWLVDYENDFALGDSLSKDADIIIDADTSITNQ